MLNTAEEVDLIGLLSRDQDLLAGMAFLSREDIVRLGRGNGERALDGTKLLLR